MMQKDPNKDIQKPSVKEKLARSSAKKKVGVGEMGKPDFKAGFESAMQKERNTVLNRAKERDKDPDWYKKEAIMSSQKRDMRSKLVKVKENMVPDMPKEDIQKYIKSVTPYKYKKPLKSMSKNKLKY